MFEIPEHLPPLEISDTLLKRAKTSKFLGVVLDGNFSWKPYIDALVLKISKNIGIIFISRDYVNKNLLKQPYFSFKHRYINYASIR